MEELMEELTEDSTNENIDIYKNNIYDHIDLLEIRKLLINYPQLCIMFELLCIHINNLIN
jgi:hypothetical protein